jgi:hypothetical protein
MNTLTQDIEKKKKFSSLYSDFTQFTHGYTARIPHVNKYIGNLKVIKIATVCEAKKTF